MRRSFQLATEAVGVTQCNLAGPAPNTFLGGLFVNGNAGVSFTREAQLGGVGSGIILSGGGLMFNAASPSTLSLSRLIALGPAGGNLDTALGNTFEITNTISGSGPLVIGTTVGAGTGAVVLSGANVYTGPTIIRGGVLTVASDANLGDPAQPVNVLSGGQLRFAVPNTFHKPLILTSNTALDTGLNSVTIASPISGVSVGGFAKIGTGTLTLTAESPLYSGQISVFSGTLALAGSGALPQVTTIGLSPNSTLAGDGSIGGEVSALSSGAVAPGHAGPGKLSTGRLILRSGSIYRADLDGTVAGTETDQINVTGNVLLGGADLLLTLGFTPPAGASFVIINNDGTDPVQATFNGLAEGSRFNFGGHPFSISYQGGTGNDVVLTVVIQLTGAVSRKTHGSAGAFDVSLPLSGEPGVECRSSGGHHSLIFTFNSDVVSGSASVTGGTGTVTGSPVFSGNMMSVDLTGVSDIQQIIVTLNGVTNNLGQILPNTAVRMNLLVGDTTGNKAVNASDVGQTKNQSGQVTSMANFRTDVNLSGTVTASDIGQVKVSTRDIPSPS